MAYIDFYDIAGSLDKVKDLAHNAAPSALVREDGFQRQGHGEIHRVYITSQDQRTALDLVTHDTFLTL